MPFPPEVRQRLRIGRVRPEASGDLLARNRSRRVEGEIGEQLLLTDRERARHRRSVDDDAESTEEFEPDGARS